MEQTNIYKQAVFTLTLTMLLHIL